MEMEVVQLGLVVTQCTTFAVNIAVTVVEHTNQIYKTTPCLTHGLLVGLLYFEDFGEIWLCFNAAVLQVKSSARTTACSDIYQFYNDS